MISAFGVEHGDISKGERAILAGAAGVGAGVGAGINEVTRHARNKRSGTKVSIKNQYLHPYKANAQWTNAREAKVAARKMPSAN